MHWSDLVRFAATVLPRGSVAAEGLASRAICKLLAGEVEIPADCDLVGLRKLAVGVIRNLAKHEHRREQRHTSVTDGNAPSERQDPFRDAENAELASALVLAFGTLAARERQAAWLHWHDQLTFPEVAERMGTSVKTAKEQVRRARPKLKAALARFRDHPGRA
jgi:RNA polymerase sigma factor (sigma-70 family)